MSLTLPRIPNPGEAIKASDYAVLVRYVKSITPRSSPNMLIDIGTDGTTFKPILPVSPRSAIASAFTSSWPFKVVNTSQGSTGQVQINGGDGFSPTLNGKVANVNDEPANTKVDGVYPQLSITGNGFVYLYVVVTVPGNASGIQSFDIFYSGTVPGADPAQPQTYLAQAIATISNYATDDAGNVTFDVGNTTNTGFAILTYCANSLVIY